MSRLHIEPDEKGCFEEQMVFHMQKQTEFLEAIYKTMEAFKTVVAAAKWISGLAIGIFGLWELVKTTVN